MNDLEFTSSDFTAAPTGNAHKMSAWVSTKLSRKLEKCPKIFIKQGLDGSNFSASNDGTYTHTALLVCIEEIK